MNMTNISHQWYKQVWATVLFLVLFPPVGIYLMFKYRNSWNKNMKLGLGIASIALFLVLILGSLFGGSDDALPVNAQTSSTSSFSDEELTFETISENAAADAKTATETDLKDAFNYIRNNIFSLFNDQDTMHHAIYCGLLIENHYKSVNEEYARVGTLACRTVKRVYLHEGYEGDSTTKTNLDSLIKAIQKIENDLFADNSPSSDSSILSSQTPPSSSSDSSTVTSSSKPKPPASSSQPKPPSSSSKETVSKDPNQSVQVYRTRTGKRYHYDSNCNGGTYYPCTLAEARDLGLTPCNKCVH